MIVASRLSKTNKPTMGSKIAKTSPSALADAARRRRKLVLKPIKQDTFLSGVSIRKAMGHRRERVRRLSPVPKCNAKDKSQPTMLLPASYNVSCDDSTDQPAQITHVGGGISANCVIASRMPEILQRPELHDVLPQVANRSAHASQLALKGLEIVRRELIKNGDSLFTAVANAVCEPIQATHSCELPQFVNIRVPSNVPREHIPSHMLMVHSCQKNLKLHKMIAVPVHSPVLAAFCSRVPRLPNPRPPSLEPLDSQPDACKRVVPLVPFAIPSPETFPLIVQFLCTQNAMHLLEQLVPIPPSSGDYSKLSKHLADTYTGASLLSNAMRVYGVWQNACSLGVLNAQIWEVIDVAWKGYRDALLLAQR